MTGRARRVRVLGTNKGDVLVSNFDVFEIMGEATGKILLVVHTLTGRDPHWAPNRLSRFRDSCAR